MVIHSILDVADRALKLGNKKQPLLDLISINSMTPHITLERALENNKRLGKTISHIMHTKSTRKNTKTASHSYTSELQGYGRQVKMLCCYTIHATELD